VLIWAARGEKGRKYSPRHWESFAHGKSGRAWGISVQVVIMAVGVGVVLAQRP
jgi:hypothetical protein